MDLNIGYFFTVHGLLFILEFFLSMIVLICAAVKHCYQNSRGVVFFTAIGCMITSFVFIMLHLLYVPANSTRLHWNLSRLVVSAFWGLFYFISLWICVAIASDCYFGRAEFTAAAIFCAFALIVCGWDTIIYFFKVRRNNAPPQN